jgi:hypothetical protein
LPLFAAHLTDEIEKRRFEHAAAGCSSTPATLAQAIRPSAEQKQAFNCSAAHAGCSGTLLRLSSGVLAAFTCKDLVHLLFIGGISLRHNGHHAFNLSSAVIMSLISQHIPMCRKQGAAQACSTQRFWL